MKGVRILQLKPTKSNQTWMEKHDDELWGLLSSEIEKKTSIFSKMFVS